MKKFFALLLTLVMVLSLAACSSAPDKQPAIDAFNETSAVFNEAGAIINENADAVDPEVIATFQDMSALLNQYGELLRGDTEIEQEKLDEMTEWLSGDALEWATSAKTELEAYFVG